MTPTEKEEILNQFDKKFAQKDFRGALKIWEDCNHDVHIYDELDYYIFIYVFEAHEELKQYKTAYKYLSNALYFKLTNNFNDRLLTNKDATEYLWTSKLLLSNRIKGIAGIIKTMTQYEKWGGKEKKNELKYLALVRGKFHRKILTPTACGIIIISVAESLLSDYNIIPDYKLTPWLMILRIASLIISTLYLVFPKLFKKSTDRIMIKWLKHFRNEKVPLDELSQY